MMMEKKIFLNKKWGMAVMLAHQPTSPGPVR